MNEMNSMNTLFLYILLKLSFQSSLRGWPGLTLFVPGHSSLKENKTQAVLTVEQLKQHLVENYEPDKQIAKKKKRVRLPW